MNILFQEVLQNLDSKNLRRRMRLVDGPQGREIVLDGKKVLNFCSNNYLGLADDPRLRQAAIDSLIKEGVGSGASRLVCGNMSAHEQLERRLAEFKRTESCLVFNTGYMANVGVISSVCERGDIIFSDKLNHASIIDGILLSQADFKRYPHNDTDTLAEWLKSSTKYRRRLIVTDSVFSMDGDVAPLTRIVELAQAHDAMVMVDEAHAFGVLGANGRGAVEELDLEGKIAIQMGTLSKAAGVFGAYVCASRTLTEFLLNRTRSFIYTTALPPSIAAAAVAAVDIIEHEPARRRLLKRNAEFVRTELGAMGFDTLNSVTPIIPIMVKESPLALSFSQKLLEQGIFVQAIRPPTVPANTARLRVTVMATHTPDDLERFLNAVRQVGKELCLI